MLLGDTWNSRPALCDPPTTTSSKRPCRSGGLVAGAPDSLWIAGGKTDCGSMTCSSTATTRASGKRSPPRPWRPSPTWRCRVQRLLPIALPYLLLLSQLHAGMRRRS